MPRIVDHDGRRRELVETTWRVIAARGLGGATLRQIAEEAGYANGALKPYFPTKADLIDATYAHVAARTEERIDAALRDRRGLAALRALCEEVLPLDEELLDEARLVISFWDRAARDDAEAAVAAATLAAWRARLTSVLGEAAADGEIAVGMSESVVDLLLTWLFGAQITAAVDPDGFGPVGLRGQVEALVGLLRP